MKFQLLNKLGTALFLPMLLAPCFAHANVYMCTIGGVRSYGDACNSVPKLVVHTTSSTASTSTTVASTPTTTSKPILTATDFMNNSYRGVNIVNGSGLNEKDYVDLATSGAKLVRVGINLIRCKKCSSYTIDPANLNYAKNLVNYGQKYGFHVVITIATLPGGDKSEYWNNSNLLTSIAQNWQEIALTFKNNPVVAGYDLINEPVPHQSGGPTADATAWFNFAAQLIPAIRKIDTDHAIIVEAAPWDVPSSFKLLKPLPFSNIVYSVHMYETQKITHQGIPGFSQIPASYPGTINGVLWDKAKLSAVFDPVRKFAKTNHVPILVGEFSCGRFAPGQTRENWIKDVTDLMDAEGWSWTYFAYRAGWTGFDAEIVSQYTPTNDTQRSSSAPVFNMLKQGFFKYVAPQSSH